MSTTLKLWNDTKTVCHHDATKREIATDWCHSQWSNSGKLLCYVCTSESPASIHTQRSIWRKIGIMRLWDLLLSGAITPKQTRPVFLFGTLVTDLNASDWIEKVMGIHNKPSLVMSGAWRLVCRLPVRMNSRTGNMPGFDTWVWEKSFLCGAEDKEALSRRCGKILGRRRDVKVIIYDNINLLQYEFSDNKVEYCKWYG